MPFADDVRKYTFTSLERLLSSKGEEVKEHPYLPTEAQDEAMDIFVDMMDLMEAGDKDEEGYVMIYCLTDRILTLLLFSAVVSPGTTRATLTTPPSIGSSRHSFTQQLSLIWRNSQYRRHIPRYSNFCNRQKRC